jgi:AcrR family transcriptional regulator
MRIHVMNLVSSPEPPLTRREEAKALFRNAILDAAERVFAANGFHVARIQDVAKEARIAVGTVYNHFEQKEDLLRALLEERTEQMLGRLAALPSDPEPFEERLTARLARVLAYVEAHRDFVSLAMEHGVFGKGSAAGDAVCGGKRMRHVERFRTGFRALIEEGLAAGALEPMDAQSLVWCLAGILRMFTLGALEHQAPSLAALAPTITRLFLHGATRKPPSSPRARTAGHAGAEAPTPPRRAGRAAKKPVRARRPAR